MLRFMYLVFLIVIARAYSLAVIEGEEGEGSNGNDTILREKKESLNNLKEGQVVTFTVYVQCACNGAKMDKPDLYTITSTCINNEYKEIAKSDALKDSYRGDVGQFELKFHRRVDSLVYIQLWDDNGGTDDVKMYETNCFDPFRQQPQKYMKYTYDIAPCPPSTKCKERAFALKTKHPKFI